MTKDWKDCPFGTVFTYQGTPHKDRSVALKLAGVGGSLTLVHSDLVLDKTPYSSRHMRRELGCDPEHLQWMIPKEYLT